MKMMTGKQVIFLQKLLQEKLLPPEEWAKIYRGYKIKSEEDLYHLNVEQASALISRLLRMAGSETFSGITRVRQITQPHYR